MARVSIYVPDELKARMGEVGDAINWSDVARPAFEEAIATYKHRKDKSVETAVERLRASKAKHSKMSKEFGYTLGRDWAANRAEYPSLVALQGIDTNKCLDDPSKIFDLISDKMRSPVDGDETILYEYDFGIKKNTDDPEAMIGFVRGAQDFYEEVKGQL